MDLEIIYLIPRLSINQEGAIIGGSANNAITLAKEIHRQGINIKLIAPVSSDMKSYVHDYLSPLPVDIIPIDQKGFVFRGLFAIFSLRKAAKLESAKRPALVVHSHSGTFPYAFTALGARSSCIRLHSLYCPFKGKGGAYSNWWESKMIAALMFSKLDRTIVVSQNIENSLISSGVAKKDQTLNIPMSVDTSRFNPEVYSKSDSYYAPETKGSRILFVGNSSEEKGLYQLIEALHLLKKDKVKVSLIATIENMAHVGKYRPNYERIQGKIKASGLTEDVDFLGIVGCIEKLYSEADIVVIPWNSTRGPSDIPLVALEAMSMGKCVICSPLEGIKNVITNNESGLITEDFSSKAVAQALQRLLSDPDLREKLSKNALRDIQKFSVEAIATRMIETYKSLLNSKQKTN